MTITATDSSQNKIINGTGSIIGQPKDGFPAGTYYYTFNYEFNFTGTHTFTFGCLDATKTQSITIN
jgi:hypothetical protein